MSDSNPLLPCSFQHVMPPETMVVAPRKKSTSVHYIWKLIMLILIFAIVATLCKIWITMFPLKIKWKLKKC